MKDYSKMSDFEINQAVTCELYCCHDWSTNEEGTFYHCGADGSGFYIQTVADYCNNPSDAWPIMKEHKIGLAFVNGECRASSVKAGYHEYSDKNAFKSAMIVYLMMKDEQ